MYKTTSVFSCRPRNAFQNDTTVNKEGQNLDERTDKVLQLGQ